MLPDAPLPPDQAAKSPCLPEADAYAYAYAYVRAQGPAPPNPPKASREERRFNGYDWDRDEIIAWFELMSSRTKAFKNSTRTAIIC